jgi:pyruvate dehydrogenase E1 component alpha subunit
LNIASVWGLPVVFVCENNLYAMGTRQSRVMNIENIADRASAYGFPGMMVDGNDVVAVYEASAIAVERARRCEGPTLIECKTYRRRGHSRVDPAKYRPKDEVQEWLGKDPIKLFKERLIQGNIFSEGEIVSVEKEVETRIEEAVRFALDSPFPMPTEALQDVYA